MKILVHRKSRAIKIHILPAVVVGGCKQTLLSQVRELFHKTHIHIVKVPAFIFPLVSKGTVWSQFLTKQQKSHHFYYFLNIYLYFLFGCAGPWLQQAGSLVVSRSIFLVATCGIWFPDQGSKLSPLLWVLATREIARFS